MAKNNIPPDAEFRGLKMLAKNERRTRLFANSLIVAAFLMFLFVAYQLLQIDQHLEDRFKDTTQKQAELVADALRDSNIRTEEFRRYNTCLLIIPLEKRSPENQLFCFKKSDLPGGRDNSEFVPIEFGVSDTAVGVIPDVLRQSSQPSKNAESSSSPNNTTTPNQSQSDNRQSPPNQTPTPTQPSEPNPPQPNVVEQVIDRVKGLL